MNFKELREKYRSKYPASLVSAAVKIAIDMAGNMTGAYKKIENMKRGLGDDPIVKDALRMANESVEEGTMAIGIKDRDPKERAKAQAQLKVLLKKIGNKTVGSKEGQDFDDKLDYDILSDDELADEFANPKNKNMKVKDLLKKHSKRLNVNFDESVEEGMSPADKKKRLEMIKKAVEKLNAKNDAKAKADFLKQMKDMVDEEVLNELNFSYAFFDKADLNKFMVKALKVKGLTVIDSEKQAGGHYTVRVKADDKKIIAKSNSLALQAMS